MTPYKQLIRHDPATGRCGDCYRTAIGCMLDIEPDRVPHFVASADTNDSKAVHRAKAWLAVRSLVLVSIPFNGDCAPTQVLEAVGRSNSGVAFMFGGMSRNGTNHVVIAADGEIIHDPALDDSGIVGPMDNGAYYVEFIIPREFVSPQLRQG